MRAINMKVDSDEFCMAPGIREVRPAEMPPTGVLYLV
jgi:hypothetical protein